MARFILAVVAVLACSVLTSAAFGAPKGFFIGGGFDGQSVSGDLDGKTVVYDSAFDRAGSVGKVRSGNGFDFDLGYMFNKNFGFEYFVPTSVTTATHRAEADATDAVVGASLLGFRLTTGGDTVDFFARLGLAGGAVTYDKYGHRGSLVGTTFTPTSDKAFTLSGPGTGIGVGVEWYTSTHLGVGLGYTHFDIKLDTVEIDGKKGTLNKAFKVGIDTTDVTILYHF